MNIATLTIAPIRPVRDLVESVRDELSTRREANRARRNLERELSHYRTPREVSDLLALINEQEGPEVEQVRQILMNNLRGQSNLFRAA